MSSDPSQSTEKNRRLDQLVTAYLEAVEAGQRPDRQEWLARNPDVAEELEEFFAEQDRMECAAAPLRQAIRMAQADGTADPNETLDQGERPSMATGTRLENFGDYELLQEIGQGGSGAVYQARQLSLNRVVALKFILAGRLATQAERQRFKNEAEAVANLDHPHIVPIYEVGEHQGEPYFSMKFLGGGSLAKVVASGQWLVASKEHQRQAARLLAQVARAVHYAHQHGIVHRDLKPGNILLQFPDGSPPSTVGELQSAIPLVTDFGLAKRVEGDSGLTQSGAIIGTPSYMAPEQASGKRGAVTTATDVYGLGAILYALLTGRPPFRADTVFDTLVLVKEREPEHPSHMNPWVDRDLETICLKCLQKDPEQRYRSAEDLAGDLDHWLRGEPIRARPIGPAAQLWRWCRRNPLVATLAAAVLVLLLGSIAGLAVSNLLIRQEQKQTRAQQEKAEANFRRIGAAVDSYFTRVSESQQLRAHGLEKLRRDLLRDAKEFYEQFAQEAGDQP